MLLLTELIDRYNWDNEYGLDTDHPEDRATHPAFLLSSQQMVGNDISNLHQKAKSIKHIYIYLSVPISIHYST